MKEILIEDLGAVEITIVYGETEKVCIEKFDEVHRVLIRRLNSAKKTEFPTS